MDKKELELEDLFYIECEQLTPFEKRLRELCFLYINPVIKNCIANWDYEEFKKYSFNSCRQTAVFTNYILYGILDEIFNNDSSFTDEVELLRLVALECYMKDGNFEEEYVHCINILEYQFKDHPETFRRITIDMSRTIYPLLFYVEEYKYLEYIKNNDKYPLVSPYDNISIILSSSINDYIYDVEYFSKRRGIDSAPIMKEIILDNYINHYIESRYKAYEVYKNFAPLILKR